MHCYYFKNLFDEIFSFKQSLTEPSFLAEVLAVSAAAASESTLGLTIYQRAVTRAARSAEKTQ